MNTINLIVWLIVTWAMFRVLAGRATLSLPDFFAVFVAGAFASTILAIAAERVESFALDLDLITHLAAAPVDELTKAAAILIAVGWFKAWRQLTISDYALIGLAGGLGYEFVNWDLAMLSGVEPAVWHSYLFGSLAYASLPAYYIGALTAAFVGLVAGICVRLLPRRTFVIAAVLLAVLVVSFDNGMFRWQIGGLLPNFSPRAKPVAEFVKSIHGLLLNGRLELWLLVGGVLLANWLEGRWTRVNAPAEQDQHLLAEDASVAFVPVEWLASARRLPYGWAAFARVSEYFRDRRAYALIKAEARRSPTDSGLAAAASELEQKLKAARISLAQPEGRTVPAFKLDGKRIVQWLAAHPLQLIVVLLFVAYFMVPPNASQGFKAVVASDITVLVPIIASVALLVRRRMKLETAKTGTFRDEFAVLLGGAAVMATLVAIGAYFFPIDNLAPHYRVARLYPLEPFELWSGGDGGYPLGGANPHSFFAAAAFFLSYAASVWPAAARASGPARESVPNSLASASIEGA